MKEIGGYIELDKYELPMMHKKAIALNCGRNALAYVIKARNIKKILLPKFLCDSVASVCRKENVQIRYYSIGKNFLPYNVNVDEDEYLYLVNYYGQISNEEIIRCAKNNRIIVDNAQAYFQEPIEGVDTLYTCRKYFGVADGAFLYTKCRSDIDYELDISYDRMKFLLGRFERTASEFYGEYSNNNKMFAVEPIKYMSKLTENLLHGIDYQKVKDIRTCNFVTLHSELRSINGLSLKVSQGAFMYPLYIENADVVRKELQLRKIYVPTLWPDVFNICEKNEIEYDMAKNIIPIPVDQRYNESDMMYIVEQLKDIISQR